jgi:cell division protein FtsB
LVTRKRLILAIILLLLFFAVQGGEYSTWDWLALRRTEREERSLIRQLEREVDSLKREALLVETDPATQERLARELYAMLRAGEFAYIIERGRAADRLDRNSPRR